MSESSQLKPSSIYLTGRGLVCPFGQDIVIFWRALIDGRSGIGPLRSVATAGLRNGMGGEVEGFDWSQWGEEGDCDEAGGWAFAAASLAAREAGLDSSHLERAGLIFATNFAGAASWETCRALEREGVFDAESFAQFLPDHALSYTARRWNNQGPRLCLSNACSSGAHALGLAADWLESGRAEVVIAGGFDGLSLSTLAGLSILRTITPDQIRPFDARRNGTLFGGGAAFCVLETHEHWRARGAPIAPCARLAGWSANNNAHHLTAPDAGGAGLARVMGEALDRAGWEPASLDYINAHGTGTQYNDLAETRAIQSVFGDHAPRLAISSTKAATSHLMGAAGSLEAIIASLAIQHDVVPPTLNLEQVDPELHLDFVPLHARPKRVARALSNSSGIGGNNACLLLEEVNS